MSLAQRLSRHKLSLLGLLVVCLLAGLVTCNMRNPRHDPRLEAIRKAGYPVTLAELDKWFHRPPDAENAALIYTNAFALMTSAESTGAAILDITLPMRGETLADDDRAALAGLVASNAPALRVLYSAQGLTNSHYPMDLSLGFGTLLPHLTKVKQAVTLLATEATLQAEKGDHAAAARSLLCAIPVARSLDTEPLLISQLVRYASLAMIVSRLESIENAAPFTDAELVKLQASLAQAEHPAAAARALAGERAMGRAYFDDRQLRSSWLAGGGGPMGGPPPSTGARFSANAMMFAYQSSGLFAKDRAYYLDAMATNVAAAELDYPARFIESQKTTATFVALPKRFHILSRMILPALGKFYIRDAEHASRIRVAQAALAVERYRLAHESALPESLTDLVPMCLPAVPVDPCDGQPLRFKKLEKGFVIYGVGSDGVDNGGLERKPKATGNYDVTFTVER